MDESRISNCTHAGGMQMREGGEIVGGKKKIYIYKHLLSTSIIRWPSQTVLRASCSFS